ncbi:DUF2189 domain-containing protein [Eilatimonas milleporae]|uniref:Putative membrane protein n=1 Tax=Eilatimonas milleporae TaxID=911205 RepID=A0A3M0CGX2_9PROT|nr:DUF2189 domain-containing protein [Eilatimonas milleporae]RMB07770.1 putative membrane protein [Eilatimonas milleporae]
MTTAETTETATPQPASGPKKHVPGQKHVTGPTINPVTAEDPWRWLSAGWKDLTANAANSLVYGAAFTGISFVLLLMLFQLELTATVLVLSAGFMLVGPVFAIGLYDASRRLAAGEKPTLDTMFKVKLPAPIQMAYMGLTLMLIYLAWVRMATLVYAMFFGLEPFPPLENFLPTLLFSAEGAWMLVIGSIIGGVTAFGAYAVSVVAVPMLMDRDVDFLTATITSIRTIRENFWPMMLWGWLIALFTAFGIATLFVGLVVVFPLIGHASWHAYRQMVGE